MNELSKQIRPLTFRRKDGRVYERPPEIEQQISDVLNTASQNFMERVKETNVNSPLYLKEETLVYFFHQAILDESFDLQEEIAKVISERCLRLSGRRIKTFVEQKDIEDCRKEIIAEVFSQLLTYGKASCEYSQIRFGSFLSKIAIAVTKKYSDWNTEDSNQFSFNNESDEAKNTNEPIAHERLSRQNLMELESLLKQLPQDIRSVFILYHGHDMQIESKDPDVPNLAKLFGKTPRTIYNMIKKAETMFQEMKGEKE